jgi:hypothetical protein
MRARATLPSCWIRAISRLNLEDRVVEVHRHPRDGRYASVTAYRGDDTIALRAFPDIVVTARELVG